MRKSGARCGRRVQSVSSGVAVPGVLGARRLSGNRCSSPSRRSTRPRNGQPQRNRERENIDCVDARACTTNGDDPRQLTLDVAKSFATYAWTSPSKSGRDNGSRSMTIGSDVSDNGCCCGGRAATTPVVVAVRCRSNTCCCWAADDDRCRGPAPRSGNNKCCSFSGRTSTPGSSAETDRAPVPTTSRSPVRRLGRIAEPRNASATSVSVSLDRWPAACFHAAKAGLVMATICWQMSSPTSGDPSARIRSVRSCGGPPVGPLHSPSVPTGHEIDQPAAHQLARDRRVGPRLHASPSSVSPSESPDGTAARRSACTARQESNGCCFSAPRPATTAVAADLAGRQQVLLSCRDQRTTTVVGKAR